jgi:hypothetical protein
MSYGNIFFVFMYTYKHSKKRRFCMNRSSWNRVGFKMLAVKAFLFVAVALNALALAQEDVSAGTPRPNAAPSRVLQNTVTVDIAPLVLSVAFSQAGSLLEELFHEAYNPNTSSFGIGVQYERMINEKFSVVGRFDYMQFSLNLTASDPSLLVPPTVYISETIGSNIWGVEAQARYYPINNWFYAGGMLGFAGMAAGYEYEVRASFGDTYTVSVKPWRNYIKIAPLVGQKSTFGGPRGGFVWETYFGYHIAIGLGKTYASRLFNEIKREGLDEGTELGSAIEDIVEAMELLFMSGPRIASSIGWRF